MKEFKLLPGMKVCIKRTANKSKDFHEGIVTFKGINTGRNFPMTIQLGLYGEINSIKSIGGMLLVLISGGCTDWYWPASCIDKSKPVIDLDGKKVYIQKRKLVI